MNRIGQRGTAILFLLLLLAVAVALLERARTMGFWDSLFGKPAPRQKVTGDLARHRAYLDSLRHPAIHLVPATTPGFSHLGGLPSVPAGFEWPLWQGKPQSFLLQIDLATLPAGVLGAVPTLAACPSALAPSSPAGFSSPAGRAGGWLALVRLGGPAQRPFGRQSGRVGWGPMGWLSG